MVKGYKVFNPDWRCRDKQYTCPGTFEENVNLHICSMGMHFCKKAADCFNYYKFDPLNHVAEVIAIGDIEETRGKCRTNKLEIVREISWAALLEIVNTGKGCDGNWNSGDWNSGHYNSGDGNSGDWNSGQWNSGDRNSGDWNSGNRNSGNYNSGQWNSGHWNSGDWNSGNWNSGDWNSGNRNSGDYNSGNGNSGDWNKTAYSSGCFNTEEPKIYLFNKPSELTYRDWRKSKARSLLNGIDNSILDWIWLGIMTDEEKEAHPEAAVTGGYLKKLDNSECAVIWWRGLKAAEKNVILSIPNFDKSIFKEITGIDVDKED